MFRDSLLAVSFEKTSKFRLSGFVLQGLGKFLKCSLSPAELVSSPPSLCVCSYLCPHIYLSHERYLIGLCVDEACGGSQG